MPMQGNCSEPDAAAELGLSPEEAEALDLMSLKPHQCLLLVDGNTIFSRGGPLWLDNLYIKLAGFRTDQQVGPLLPLNIFPACLPQRRPNWRHVMADSIVNFATLNIYLFVQLITLL